MATNSCINNICTNDFSVSRSNSGGTVKTTVANTSDTASSIATELVQVAGTTADDPFTIHRISGSTVWSTGLDNSDSDIWKISNNATLGTNDYISCNISGSVKSALTPAFLAYQGSNLTNATGNGTAYLIGYTTALTEVFDQQSNLTVGGSSVAATFTAPVTGKYELGCVVRLAAIGSTTYSFNIKIITSNRTYSVLNNGPLGASATTNSAFATVLADMDSSDTATFSITVTGQGADSVTVAGSSDSVTFISGNLNC